MRAEEKHVTWYGRIKPRHYIAARCIEALKREVERLEGDNYKLRTDAVRIFTEKYMKTPEDCMLAGEERARIRIVERLEGLVTMVDLNRGAKWIRLGEARKAVGDE